MTEQTITTGQSYLFIAREHDADEGHPVVTVLAPLHRSAYDEPEVGPMWVVAFPDGTARSVFADELKPVPLAHVFQPYVNVVARPDGRWDVSLDWADSYLGAESPDGPDPANPEHAAVCDAVDAWAKTLPASAVIPAAPAAPDEYDLLDALARAQRYLSNAAAALDDEHERGVQDALVRLRAVSADMASFAESW